MLPDPITAVADVPLSPEVQDFCQRQQLLDPLAKAIELVRRCFTVVGEPSVQLEQDPEDGEWYLVLDVRSRGDESESIRAHREYHRSWASAASWPAVHQIRLICDVIEE
jgi:hypothetical protein